MRCQKENGGTAQWCRFRIWSSFLGRPTSISGAKVASPGISLTQQRQKSWSWEIMPSFRSEEAKTCIRMEEWRINLKNQLAGVASLVTPVWGPSCGQPRATLTQQYFGSFVETQTVLLSLYFYQNPTMFHSDKVRWQFQDIFCCFGLWKCWETCKSCWVHQTISFGSLSQFLRYNATALKGKELSSPRTVTVTFWDPILEVIVKEQKAGD